MRQSSLLVHRIACASLLLVPPLASADVFVNELHYDNADTDTSERVEVLAPAGTSLSGWSIALYNGADGNSGGWGNQNDAMPPSSNHPGGVNMSMGDGSVRFIKDTVSIQAWWGLGTRNGGEVISSDAF